MAVREARNAIKIEGWRLSRVPINPSDTIFAGDMLAWNTSTKQAVVMAPSGAPSGATFIGVADHTNPVKTIGMLLTDTQDTRINVVQHGLVEMIEDVAETVFPFDTLTVGGSAQHVHKGATNVVGVCDPYVGAASCGSEFPTRIECSSKEGQSRRNQCTTAATRQ
jgi:hypothetical protein